MINFWSSEKYLSFIGAVRPILMPFYGEVKDAEDPCYGRFDDWIARGKELLTPVDLEHADIVIYPQDPTIDKGMFANFQDYTGMKPLLVFFNADSTEKIKCRENSYIFRTSAYRSKADKNEYGLAAWSKDWGQLSIRPWAENPVVGFCGQDRTSIRNKALNILEKSPVNTNFIRKNKFWGGWTENRSPELGKSLRQEFINNMENSDYVFCARGGGNFSYRLYETLMSGRIPLVIDTDCLFPLPILNDRVFPIVDEKNVNNIYSVLMDYHSLLRNTYKYQQNYMRLYWGKYLSPYGFFKYILENIVGGYNG